jgi:quinol monooxygenase YgiN
MIILKAVLQAKKGEEAELEKELRAIIPHVQAEPGTLVYTLHRSRKDPCRFMFYEKYSDRAALDFHAATPYLKNLFSKFDSLLEKKPDVELFEELAGIKR